MADFKTLRIPLGGMDDRPLPAPGTASRIVEMHQDADGSWRTMGGVHQVTGIVTGLETLALHWFQPRPGIRHLLLERAVDSQTSRISTINFQSGAAEQIITTRRRLTSADVPTQFLDIDQWCYFLSPLDGLSRWDGRRILPVGFTTPPPMPVVAGPDQSFDENDKAGGTYPATFKHRTQQRGLGSYPDPTPTQYLYGYGLTVQNDLGQESPLGPLAWLSGDNNTPAADGFTLGRLQVPRMGTGIMGVRLWRTVNLVGVEEPGQGSTVYLCEEWPNAGGFDWIDARSDAELGIAHDPDGSGLMPTGARAMAFWQGTLFLGGMPDNPTRVRISAPLFHEQFPEQLYVDVGSSRSGGILAFQPLQRGLAVFKHGGVFLIKGNHAEGFRVEAVSETIGAAAPRAIVTIPAGVAFVARSGPYLLRGSMEDDQPTEVMPIGQPVAQFWRKKVGPNLGSAVACYDPEHHEVWFQLPFGGDPRPKIGLVLHTLTGAWSQRNGWTLSSMTYYAGRLWVGSWDEQGAFVLTQASRTHVDGSTLNARYDSNGLLFDEMTGYTRADIWMLGLGTNRDLELTTRTDYGAEVVQTETARKQQHQRESRDVWGTAKWGAAYSWSDYELTVVPVSVRVEVGYRQQIMVEAGRLRLVELSVAAHKGAVTRPTERT